MKNTFFYIMISIFLFGGFCHAIPLDDNWMDDFDRAKILAGKHKRNIVVVFGAEWCKPCHLLKKETLEQPEVRELIKNHLRVRVDVDEHKKIAKKFGVRSLPSVIFFNSAGEELDRFSGYVDRIDFEMKMDDAHDPKTNLPAKIKMARENFDNFEMQKELLNELIKRNAMDIGLKLIDEQLKVVKEEDVDWEVDLLFFQVNFFISNEQHEQVVERLNVIEKEHPEYADVEKFYVMRAKALLSINKQREAADVLLDFIERFPTSPDAHWARQTVDNLYTGN